MGKIFRRGARRSVTTVAVLALVAGGAFAAFAGSASAHKPSCDDEVDSANQRHHHYVLMCKEAPETAVAGTDMTYTLTTFSSTHKSDEHEFTVEDQLPEGTTLVGIDDPSWASVVDPPLSVVAQPANELGAVAAERLLARLAGDASRPRTRMLQAVWRERESIAPPP